MKRFVRIGLQLLGTTKRSVYEGKLSSLGESKEKKKKFILLFEKEVEL